MQIRKSLLPPNVFKILLIKYLFRFLLFILHGYSNENAPTKISHNLLTVNLILLRLIKNVLRDKTRTTFYLDADEMAC